MQQIPPAVAGGKQLLILLVPHHRQVQQILVDAARKFNPAHPFAQLEGDVSEITQFGRKILA